MFTMILDEPCSLFLLLQLGYFIRNTFEAVNLYRSCKSTCANPTGQQVNRYIIGWKKEKKKSVKSHDFCALTQTENSSNTFFPENISSHKYAPQTSSTLFLRGWHSLDWRSWGSPAFLSPASSTSSSSSLRPSVSDLADDARTDRRTDRQTDWSLSTFPTTCDGRFYVKRTHTHTL